jgi:hypothetical protein
LGPSEVVAAGIKYEHQVFFGCAEADGHNVVACADVLPDLVGIFVEAFKSLKSPLLPAANFLQGLEWIDFTLNLSCSRISA